MRLSRGSLLVLVVACLGLAAADVPPDTVVVTVNGKQLTAGDLERLLSGAPPDMQKQLLENRRAFVQQYALVRHLADRGEEQGLAEESPFREQLEWSRQQVLLQAAIADKRRELTDSGLSDEQLAAELPRWMDSVKAASEVEFKDSPYLTGDLDEAAKVPDETVVADVNGNAMTAGAMREVLLGATAKVRDDFKKDRKEFFRQYAMMQRLVEIANQRKLAEQRPFRDQLAWVRMNLLSQAAMNDYSDSISISRDDEREFYDANQDKYTQAHVKVLYVSFGSGDSVGEVIAGKKILSEAEARAKIEDLRQQIVDGADFIALVKEHSEDEISKAKDGDFGVIRRSDKIPEHIREALFSLQKGEVSRPVRQPNGFYLFRAEEVGVQSIEDVRQDLRSEAKGAKFASRVNSVRASLSVTFENEDYFSEPGK